MLKLFEYIIAVCVAVVIPICMTTLRGEITRDASKAKRDALRDEVLPLRDPAFVVLTLEVLQSNRRRLAARVTLQHKQSH